MLADSEKNRFDRWCDYWEVAPDKRDRLWTVMLKSGMNPGDVETFYLVATGVLEKVADLVQDAPNRVEEAAKRAVGTVAKAATVKVEAAHADLVHQVGDKVAEAASAQMERAAQTRELRLGLHLIALSVGIALAAGVVGWSAGRYNVSGVAAEWAGIASRADQTAWLGLMAANPDLAANLRSCAPGANRVRVVEGARYCDVPLWLEPPRPPVAAGALTGAYSTVLDALYGYGPLWLIGGGLLAGLLGRKLLLSLFSWRPLRWLLG